MKYKVYGSVYRYVCVCVCVEGELSTKKFKQAAHSWLPAPRFLLLYEIKSERKHRKHTHRYTQAHTHAERCCNDAAAALRLH